MNPNITLNPLKATLKITLFAMVALLMASSCNSANKQKGVSEDPWLKIDSITNSIAQTSFPDTTFNILDFGAKPDGLSLNTQSFANAIAACAADGGGKVVVPKGKFLTGPIHLKSNVNLHLLEGAEVLFSRDTALYYPLVHTSWEGTEVMNYSPLIYAKGQTNIAVTGKGILNGQADNEYWWPWCGKEDYGWKEDTPNQQDPGNRPKLVEMAAAGIPVAERIFGDGKYLRPTFIEPFECDRVLIKDVKIINAPFWVIHPLKSQNVIVDGVTVDSHGPNNDGCDPEYSKNVWIKNCVFNTGDDCIAIKSGRNEDGRRVNIPSENIIVQNCKMIDGHGGVVMGSEISAGVRNVFVENCEMDSPNLDRALRIKTNSKRGGFVENVYARNLKVGVVKEAVLKVNLFYNVHGNQTGSNIPRVRNINLENITVKDGGKYGILAKGYESSPITDITLKDVTIERVDSIASITHVKNLNLINTYINGKLIEKINQ